jgi:potassium/hydrogen antiporter
MLKGAVPILLGELLLTADVPDAERLYGIVVVVVIFSVVVQGSLVPTVARRLGVPMQPVRPDPWAVDVRLRADPRDGQLLPVRGDTRLRAGDMVTLLTDGDIPERVTEMFTKT